MFTSLFIYLAVFYVILVSHLKSSKIEWAVNKRFKEETSEGALDPE